MKLIIFFKKISFLIIINKIFNLKKEIHATTSYLLKNNGFPQIEEKGLIEYKEPSRDETCLRLNILSNEIKTNIRVDKKFKLEHEKCSIEFEQKKSIFKYIIGLFRSGQPSIDKSCLDLHMKLEQMPITSLIDKKYQSEDNKCTAVLEDKIHPRNNNYLKYFLGGVGVTVSFIGVVVGFFINKNTHSTDNRASNDSQTISASTVTPDTQTTALVSNGTSEQSDDDEENIDLELLAQYLAAEVAKRENSNQHPAPTLLSGTRSDGPITRSITNGRMRV